MNVIPDILNRTFQDNGVIPENILEVRYCDHYLIPKYGIQHEEVCGSSILDDYVFSWMELQPHYVVTEASLFIRFKKGDELEALLLKGKEELLSTRLWMRNLFLERRASTYELVPWYRQKKQEELADYVSGDTIAINDFKYFFRVSKKVISFKDLTKVSSGYKDLYNQEGYELFKRGFRIPTLDEWLHFAKSLEGHQILQNQYGNEDAYEICMADSKTILQINVKTSKLAILDFEYRRVHPGPLREGFYRYVQSPIPEKDLFSEGYVNREAARLLGEAEAEYEEYLERREPWDC